MCFLWLAGVPGQEGGFQQGFEGRRLGLLGGSKQKAGEFDGCGAFALGERYAEQRPGADPLERINIWLLRVVRNGCLASAFGLCEIAIAPRDPGAMTLEYVIVLISSNGLGAVEQFPYLRNLAAFPEDQR